jgi:hypothetical protein
MRTHVRVSIVIAIILVMVLVAGNNVAWAGPAAADQRSPEASVDQASAPSDKPDKGTVKPPPPDITICEEGIHSVGGVSTLEVNNLAPGYCLAAFLRNHAFAVGRIPPGAGEILAPITFLRVFHDGELVHELPVEDGQVEICYAVPPGSTAQIYFLNFYSPRFGERTGQPSWELLETTVSDGIACAAAQTTGAYALIGQ